MKKSLIIPLILSSMTMAICTGAGVALLKNQESLKPAEAAVSIGIDSIGNNCYYYSYTGRDYDLINLSTMTHCTDNNYYENTLLDKSKGYSEGPTLTLTTKTTQTFDVLYVPLRAYVTTPSYNSVKFSSITFSFSMQKLASGGSAPAIAELFYLEGQSTPTSFNTANNTTATNGNSVKRFATTGTSVQSATPTICSVPVTKENPSSTSQNLSIDLGLLIVGCYGSSYSNAVQVNLSVTSNSGSFEEKDLLCNGKLFNTYNYSSALSEFNGGANRTLTFLKDVSITSTVPGYRVLSQSGTIELNGHKLTSTNTSVFAITSNSTVTIQNGTIEGTTNCTSAISVGSGCTVTIPSTVTIISNRRGIDNSGSLTFSGTITAGSSGILNDAGGTASIQSGSVTTTDSGSTALHNAGTMLIRGGTYKSTGNNGHSLFISGTNADTTIVGNASLPNGIYVGQGFKTQHLALYFTTSGSTMRYTGSQISLTFADSLAADDVLFYAYNLSDATNKISITNELATYLGYTYNSNTTAYSVVYNKYSITVNMTHGNYTINKSTNVIYTDTITIVATLDTGYVLESSNVTYTTGSLCNRTFDSNTLTVTITLVRSNITVNINPVLRALTYRYDGNGTNAVTTNNGKEGYTTSGVTTNCHYGDTVTLLLNAFRRDGYMFVSWNTAEDGTGASYNPGDTMTITESTVFYAQWVEVDYAALDEFVANYMHLNDYVNNYGYCKSYQGGDGYYIIAKRALVNLTETQINIFRTDMLYIGAKNRYEAWAYANNDLEYAYVNDFTHISNTKDVKVINNSNTLVIVAIVSAASLTTVGLFFFIRKKKHQ